MGENPSGCKNCGCIVIYYNTDPKDNGLYLFIQNPVTGWTTPWAGRGKNPVTPLIAKQIDQKMDDAMPETSDIMGYPADDFCKKDMGGGKWDYVVANLSKDCVVSFRF